VPWWSTRNHNAGAPCRGDAGLLVGTSSALNVLAAIGIAREIGAGKVVATVAVDTGLKYLNGDLVG
jgi:cysteine synthase